MCDLTLFLEYDPGSRSEGRTMKQRERLERKLHSAPVPWAAPAWLGLQVGDEEEAAVQRSSGVGCSVRPACVCRRSQFTQSQTRRQVVSRVQRL